MALAGHHGARADGASRGVDGARNASAVVMAQPHQPRGNALFLYIRGEGVVVLWLRAKPWREIEPWRTTP
ncbi:hypothetical protein Tco_0117486, partial [Tanacetum coccineum]